MSILTFFAETGVSLTPQDIGVTDAVTDPNSLLVNVLTTAYFWAGIVCVIIIIIGGFYYVISNGNAANVKKGKDAITGAIIGLIVIIVAFTLTQFIIGRF